MKKEFYSYEQFKSDLKKVLPSIKTFSPDAIVSIARGGNTYGHFISQSIDNRNLLTINCTAYNDTEKLDNITVTNIPNLDNFNSILIVDDICDSGDTLYFIINAIKDKYPNIEIKTTTLFFKKDAKIKVDFTINEAKNWITFFWESDF
jgi:xanthine phosphoribosyltransferase